MTWSCEGGATGSFAGQALGDSCAFFTGGDSSQGSQLGFWLWVGSAWGGPAVTLASFLSGDSTEPAWALLLTPDGELHLCYAQSFPGAWSFTGDVGAAPSDCWCWVSLSAADGAFRWSIWLQDGSISSGSAAMPGPATGYSVTGDGRLALGHDLSGLANATFGGGAQEMQLDGGLKVGKLLYVELPGDGNQADPITSASFVQTLPGEGAAAFLMPHLADWPTLAAARASNCGGVVGAFTGFFAATGQGYDLYTAAPNQGFVFANGPAAVLPEWVRVRHSSGQGFWQSSGDVTEEWAGGARRLLLPFATLGGTPELLMGRDPSNGLPAFCPPPSPSPTPVPPVPVPPGSDPLGDGTDPCVAAKCGAALAMAQHLQDSYEFWQNLINAALSATYSISVQVVLGWIGDVLRGLVVAEKIAAWVLTVFNKFKGTLSGLTLFELGAVLPPWDDTTVTNVQQVFFCALQCSSGTVSVSSDDLNNVGAFIVGHPSNFLGNNVAELLDLLVIYSSLSDWTSAVTGAVPSNLCNGFSCT